MHGGRRRTGALCGSALERSSLCRPHDAEKPYVRSVCGSDAGIRDWREHHRLHRHQHADFESAPGAGFLQARRSRPDKGSEYHKVERAPATLLRGSEGLSNPERSLPLARGLHISAAGHLAGRRSSSEGMFSELVTGNYFSTLGLTPAKGRFFLPGRGQRSGRARRCGHQLRDLAVALWRRGGHRRQNAAAQSRCFYRHRRRSAVASLE